MTKERYVRSYSFGRQVDQHVAVVEKVLGKVLPAGAEVHHVDGGRRNNSNSNLVVCPSSAYHKLLHRRTEALEASGNANYQKCQYCKNWDSPGNVQSVVKSDRPSTTYWHRSCRSAYRTNFKKRNGYHV